MDSGLHVMAAINVPWYYSVLSSIIKSALKMQKYMDIRKRYSGGLTKSSEKRLA